MRKRIFLLFMISLLFIKTAAQEKEVDSLFDQSTGTFLPIPLIINNPTIETGFGGVGMYFFKFDKEDMVSPPSLVNLYAIYSTNKSYILLASARMYWNEDKNRATLIAGPIRINHDFIYENDEGEDLHLVYSELRSIVTAEYSRKIFGDFYLGAMYLGTKTEFKFDKGTDEENEFTEEFFRANDITDNFISSIGLNFSFDNRNYVYNPTKGLMFSIRPKLNREWLGSDNDYVDTDFTAVYFIPLSINQVLGFSLSGGIATGDVPFDGYQSYGLRNNLRGYPVGKYRGKNMAALQAEYRRNIYNRWGAVAFAGTGSVWGNDDNGEEAFERTWLPSIGLGIRYMVSKEKRINLRLDFAMGVDGNQGVYFGIMEAF